MTYEQIVSQIKAYRHQHQERLREQAVMDHTQASLMAFALNDPSKMPDLYKAYPFLRGLGTDESKAPNRPAQTNSAWQNDQALLMQQAMLVKATLQRKKQQLQGR
ncbi:hypothetical protein [Lacticaseibacillus yichunensis]|uniref:Uncharacterized protein n=2 Tax=Lacticaseibacillus yichunensis TaxID=2486015 RepID=A0ABW4CK86_9LACO